MSIRQEVRDLAHVGRLPSESATVEEVERAQRLLESVTAPVSDDEAQLLISLFGPDNCFGLSWTLLHLIETAPSALAADYSTNADNGWVQLMMKRQIVAAEAGTPPSHGNSDEPSRG